MVDYFQSIIHIGKVPFLFSVQNQHRFKPFTVQKIIDLAESRQAPLLEFDGYNIPELFRDYPQ